MLQVNKNFDVVIYDKYYRIIDTPKMVHTYNTALSLVKRIEKIVKHHLHYDPNAHDSYSELSREELLVILDEEARFVESQIKEKPKISVFKKDLHHHVEHVDRLVKPPRLTNTAKDVLLIICNYLPIRTIVTISKTCKKCHTLSGEALIQRAKLYRYKGQNYLEAVTHLNEIHQEMVAVKKIIPHALHGDFEEKWNQLKTIDSKNLLKLVSDLHLVHVPKELEVNCKTQFSIETDPQKLQYSTAINNFFNRCYYSFIEFLVTQQPLQTTLTNQHWRGKYLKLHFKSLSENTLEKLVRNGFISPHIKVGSERLPIHYAAAKGFLKLMDCLLEYRYEFKEGCFPLNTAVKFQQKEAVRFLLAKGAQVNPEALFTAAKNNSSEILSLILENTKLIDFQDKHGETALIKATYANKIDNVKLLLIKGANTSIRDEGDFSAVRIAIEYKLMDILEILLKHGYPINEINKNGKSYLHHCHKGDPDIVKLLIKFGADVNQKTSDTLTPLTIAANEGFTAVVQILLQHGAEVDFQTAKGRTALNYAAQNGHIEIVIELLKYKANVNLCDPNGFTPLHFAAREGRREIVKLLLKQGANKEAITTERHTPAFLAASKGHLNTFNLLTNK